MVGVFSSECSSTLSERLFPPNGRFRSFPCGTDSAPVGKALSEWLQACLCT
jgi:hypothetical protein